MYDTDTQSNVSRKPAYRRWRGCLTAASNDVGPSPSAAAGSASDACRLVVRARTTSGQLQAGRTHRHVRIRGMGFRRVVAIGTAFAGGCRQQRPGKRERDGGRDVVPARRSRTADVLVIAVLAARKIRGGLLRASSVAVVPQPSAEDKARRRQRLAVSPHPPGQARCSVPGHRFLKRCNRGHRLLRRNSHAAHQLVRRDGHAARLVHAAHVALRVDGDLRGTRAGQ